MTLPRLGRLAVPAVLAALALFVGPASDAQQKKEPAKKKDGPAVDPDGILKPKPRPKRPDLPASALPLQFLPGERVALVGNSTAERMNLFGHFEAMLHSRFPDAKLVVRNFARPADEVAVRQRSADYTLLDDPLKAFGADTFLCFFGFNESFAGPAGVAKFQADYEKFIDEFAAKYPRDDAGSKPRFVIVSPIPFEPPGDPLLPDGTSHNGNLKVYADACAAVAKKRGLAFVDVFQPLVAYFAREVGAQFTINGAHLNDAGDKLLAQTLDRALFGAPAKDPTGTSQYEKLRAAVNDKSWVHMQDYRMVNGWYVYGGRRTFDEYTFPREFAKLRAMAGVRDQYAWDIAAGKAVADKPDDSATGGLVVPPTRFGQPGRDYSEAKELRYLTPDEFVKTCDVPPGMKIVPFADEAKFPEIAKPVQLNFDNKGRLWLACMPSYPQWKPGDPRASDKLVILEDTDGDGKADKSTVFYDKLHCPTGFEFYNGGVLVMDQPRLLWLKDTDGDDKADLVVHLLDGWASDDTHHRGGWEWSHGGRLHLLEGIATSTTLETPWGPHRSAGAGGAYIYDPRSQAIRQFSLPGMANMWCYHFDEWGQGFVGDGTTPNQAWDTPLSGAQFSGRKGLNFLFDKGERPNLGSERLISRALPDDVQGQFVYATVITMNGLPRFSLNDDGAGFKGKRIVRPDGKPSDLIRSSDKHFRPADPQIGPDGALWFGDWANALIGHMQYSQRDPNRDHTRGRVYRLVGTDLPLVKPVTQFGKPAAEILEQFREYEWRTRYRARRELHDRPAAEVLPAVAAWVKALDTNDPIYDRLTCEALWVQQGFHRVDRDLLDRVLAAKTPQARAAAVHVLSDERAAIPQAIDRLVKATADPHPRVRTEAARGLSFFATPAAAVAVLAAAGDGSDYWLKYTAEHALGATVAAWRPDYLKGTLGAGNATAQKMMSDVLAADKVGGQAAPFLKLLLGSEPLPAEVKNKAMTALAQMPGNASKGREVFQRGCVACHKVGAGEGQDYGPNLDKVATKLKTKVKVIESMIDPNAEVDAKYLSTRIDKEDGGTVTGLLVSETKAGVVIFDGKDRITIAADNVAKKTTLKQSSMPEGLAGTMSPGEFLDLTAYLWGLK